MNEECDKKLAIKAKKYALQRLARCNQSTHEMTQALLRKGFSEDISSKIIADCQRLGYLNDQEWTEGFIRSKIAQNYGSHTILAKMKLKGVSKESGRLVLSELDLPEERLLRIQNLIQKKYRTQLLQGREDAIRRALFRRGFDPADIEEALRNVNSLTGN